MAILILQIISHNLTICTCYCLGDVVWLWNITEAGIDFDDGSFPTHVINQKPDFNFFIQSMVTSAKSLILLIFVLVNSSSNAPPPSDHP